MRKTLSILLLALVALAGYAQDVTIDLTSGVKQQGDVSLSYPFYDGAGIYYERRDYYSLQIKTTQKKIAHIEFEGELSASNKTADLEVANGNGTLEVKSDGISRWEGLAYEVKFQGCSSSTGYLVTTLRIWYEGTPFTPTADSGSHGPTPYLGGSSASSHYYAPAPTLPKDGKAVRMAFIYPEKFRNALQDYMVWKTKQGYEVVEINADEVSRNSGKTGEALALEIRQQMMNMNPRPAYILICGDTDLVPKFGPHVKHESGQTAATDFYYGEFSGDLFAEAYVGRFSADNETQLKAQMDKTKYMAMIDPAEAGWLKHSTVVDGNAGDIDTKTPLSYVEAFPKQWPENTVNKVYTASSVNREIEDGASQVTYAGHGNWSSWDDYYSYNALQLNNKGKYPVVMSLTCLTGSYQYSCLGEELMRRTDAGAVAFIGASRETYDHDNFMLVGGGKNRGYFEHLGYMRSLFHPLEEDESQLSRTIGEALNIAKFAVRVAGEDRFRMNAEYYILLGDPTYQPYITTPSQMFIEPASPSVAAGHALTVKTAPEAVVCISKGREIVAVALADKAGNATLYVPGLAAAGNYVLYSSAPAYNDLETTITITAGDGVEELRPERNALPRVQHTDVIDLNSAASALTADGRQFPTSQPEAFSAGSNAQYALWGATNLYEDTKQFVDWLYKTEPMELGIYLRNKYDLCSLITTKTAGNAAYVSVDWLNPCGQTEILSVYGSKTPYTSTSQAWTDGQNGNYLGEIRKGQNDALVIDGEWPYILVRAENYDFPAGEQNDVLFKSLTIGWNRLTSGDVDGDGKVDLHDINKLRYILANDQSTSNADVNGDGRITIADITALVSKLMKK